MGQRRDRPRLAFEARQGVGVVRKVLRQHFDRDVAAEPRVARAIHLAHAAGAKCTGDFVGTEPDTGGERHAVDWWGL